MVPEGLELFVYALGVWALEGVVEDLFDGAVALATEDEDLSVLAWLGLCEIFDGFSGGWV